MAVQSVQFSIARSAQFSVGVDNDLLVRGSGYGTKLCTCAEHPCSTHKSNARLDQQPGPDDFGQQRYAGLEQLLRRDVL